MVIGGSRGGAAAPPPPTGSISFVFTYVFAEKCTRRRLAPPPPPPPPPTGNPGSATDGDAEISENEFLHPKVVRTSEHNREI